MYNLSIFLNESTVQYLLSYKTEESAQASRDNIHARRKSSIMDQCDYFVTIKDDYGNRLDIVASNIASVLIQHQETARQADIDREIDNRRADVNFKNRRDADIELARLFPAQSSIVPGRLQ